MEFLLCAARPIAQLKNINSKKAFAFLKTLGFVGRFYRTVLYVHDSDRTQEIFLFPMGSVVFWNFRSREEKNLIDQLENFENNSLRNNEVDFFIYKYGKETTLTTHERFNADIITLEDTDPQIKLAISYGLAQSCKIRII